MQNTSSELPTCQSCNHAKICYITAHYFYPNISLILKPCDFFWALTNYFWAKHVKRSLTCMHWNSRVIILLRATSCSTWHPRPSAKPLSRSRATIMKSLSGASYWSGCWLYIYVGGKNNLLQKKKSNVTRLQVFLSRLKRVILLL